MAEVQRIAPAIGQGGGSLVDPIQPGSRRAFQAVDTFEQPAVSPMAGLAASLSQIEPSLKKYADNYMNTQNEEQQAKAQEDAVRTGLSYGEATQRGLIAPNENPFYIATYQRLDGATAADQAILAIRQQFATDPIKNEVDTGKQQAWIAARIAERAQALGGNRWAMGGFTQRIQPLSRALAADLSDQARINAVSNMATAQDARTQAIIQTSVSPQGGEGHPVVPSVGAPVASVLAQRESGGRYDIMEKSGLGYAGKYQIGGPLAAAAGFYTPGAGENVKDSAATGGWSGKKWGGTFNIPGFENVKTVQDFLANGPAQEKAYAMAAEATWKQLQDQGAERFVGQTINGITLNRNALVTGAWLGGAGGVMSWLNSGGKNDAADGNRTRVSSYLQMGSRITDSTTNVPMPGMSGTPVNSIDLARQFQTIRDGYLSAGVNLAEADKRLVATAITSARALGRADILDALEVDRPDATNRAVMVPGPGRSAEAAAHIQQARQEIQREAITRQHQATAEEERKRVAQARQLDGSLTQMVMARQAENNPQFRSQLDQLMRLDPDKAWQVGQRLEGFNGLRGSPENARYREQVQSFYGPDPNGRSHVDRLTQAVLVNRTISMSEVQFDTVRKELEALDNKGLHDVKAVMDIYSMISNDGLNTGTPAIFADPLARQIVATNFYRAAGALLDQNKGRNPETMRQEFLDLSLRLQEEYRRVNPAAFNINPGGTGGKTTDLLKPNGSVGIQPAAPAAQDTGTTSGPAAPTLAPPRQGLNGSQPNGQFGRPAQRPDGTTYETPGRADEQAMRLAMSSESKKKAYVERFGADALKRIEQSLSR